MCLWYCKFLSSISAYSTYGILIFFYMQFLLSLYCTHPTYSGGFACCFLKKRVTFCLFVCAATSSGLLILQISIWSYRAYETNVAKMKIQTQWLFLKDTVHITLTGQPGCTELSWIWHSSLKGSSTNRSILRQEKIILLTIKFFECLMFLGNKYFEDLFSRYIYLKPSTVWIEWCRPTPTESACFKWDCVCFFCFKGDFNCWKVKGSTTFSTSVITSVKMCLFVWRWIKQKRTTYQQHIFKAIMQALSYYTVSSYIQIFPFCNKSKPSTTLDRKDNLLNWIEVGQICKNFQCRNKILIFIDPITFLRLLQPSTTHILSAT